MVTVYVDMGSCTEEVAKFANEDLYSICRPQIVGWARKHYGHNIKIIESISEEEHVVPIDVSIDKEIVFFIDPDKAKEHSDIVDSILGSVKNSSFHYGKIEDYR